MANRYAVANGNWSNPATWDGGTLPAAGDTVRPNGFTVTIDVDVGAEQLINNASAPAVAGGTFNLPGGRTLSANVSGQSAGSSCVTNVASPTGVRSIVGNVIGGAGFAVSLIPDKLTVIGNVSHNGNYKAFTGTTCNLEIVGNLLAGSINGAACIFTSGGTHAIEVTGDVQSSAINQAMDLSGSGYVRINGRLICGGQPAITSQSGTAVCINGEIIHSGNGSVAVRGAGRLLVANAGEHKWTTVGDVGGGSVGIERSLYTGGVNLGQPAESDVRYPIVFGESGEYTGSLRVPDPSLVSLGVLTDNTTGTLTAGLDESALHAALDAYTNKADWKATGFATPTNVSDTQTAILAKLPESGRASAVDPDNAGIREAAVNAGIAAREWLD
jgi:hypothetical protein